MISQSISSAAIGQLAVAVWGANAVPQNWRDQLA
jgi:hypothetical protein